MNLAHSFGKFSELTAFQRNVSLIVLIAYSTKNNLLSVFNSTQAVTVLDSAKNKFDTNQKIIINNLNSPLAKQKHTGVQYALKSL